MGEYVLKDNPNVRIMICNKKPWRMDSGVLLVSQGTEHAWPSKGCDDVDSVRRGEINGNMLFALGMRAVRTRMSHLLWEDGSVWERTLML